MIFITGVTGLIGSYIARKLLSEGESVLALKREDSDLSLIEDIAHKIDWITGDVLDVNSLKKGIDKAGVVIHCAAIVSFDKKDLERLFKINVEGTANVVNLCLNNKERKLIHISSVAAIGRSKPSGTLDENTPWESSKDNTYYGRSKYLSELEVWRGVEEGLNAVILNPSVVLGPGDWSRSSTEVFRQVYKNSKFYSTGFMNYVDVRDVADITYELLKKDITGERLIINADRIPVYDFYKEVASRFGVRRPKIKITYRMAKIGVWLLWLRWVFTGKRPFINNEIIKTLRKSHFFDNAKVVSTLSYSFRPLHETLDWSVSELQKKNNLS